MRSGILEIVGIFLVIVGACGLVAAAAMISVKLAVFVAAAFVILAGALIVYVAAVLDQQQAAKTPAARVGPQ